MAAWFVILVISALFLGLGLLYWTIVALKYAWAFIFGKKKRGIDISVDPKEDHNYLLILDSREDLRKLRERNDREIMFWQNNKLEALKRRATPKELKIADKMIAHKDELDRIALGMINNHTIGGSWKPYTFKDYFMKYPSLFRELLSKYAEVNNLYNFAKLGSHFKEQVIGRLILELIDYETHSKANDSFYKEHYGKMYQFFHEYFAKCEVFNENELQQLEDSKKVKVSA